jgi:hypothetical protein
MPGNAPAREVSRQREQDAWTLRQEGRTEAAIAERLGVSQPAVSKMLRRVEARVLKDLSGRVGRMKAAQTAQLEHITSQAMRAWEVSLEDSVTVQATEGGAFVVTTKTQSGNPAHLGQARGALADIRAIWGLNAPARMALGDEELLQRATGLMVEFEKALKLVYGEEAAPMKVVG